MNKEESEARLEQVSQEELRLRRRLGELEEVTQRAPGSHSPGVPSAEAVKAEREIRTVVLALSDIDRQRQEITVALSLT